MAHRCKTSYKTSYVAVINNKSDNARLTRTNMLNSIYSLENKISDSLGGRGITLTPTTSNEYKNVIIWLHGLGDQADGWASLMQVLDLQDTKYILPSALERPISLNNGMSMPGWSDIHGLSESAEEDKDGFEASSKRIEEIISAELTKGILPERIVLAGFSQGGALALHIGLRATHKLGGVIALSTWVPFRKDYPSSLSEASKDSLRIFQAHGTADQVVKFEWGLASHVLLKELIPSSRFMRVPKMGHSSEQKELEEVRSVLLHWFKEP